MPSVKDLQFIHQGMHTEYEISMYLELTKVSSTNKISALHDFAVRGINVVNSCKLNNVDGKDFRELRNNVNKVASVVDKLINMRLSRGYLTTPKCDGSCDG